MSDANHDRESKRRFVSTDFDITKAGVFNFNELYNKSVNIVFLFCRISTCRLMNFMLIQSADNIELSVCKHFETPTADLVHSKLLLRLH